MTLGQPRGRKILGIVLAVMGSVWTLQRFDVFGQDGGMNGRAEWIVIGVVAAVSGIFLAISGFKAPSQE